MPIVCGVYIGTFYNLYFIYSIDVHVFNQLVCIVVYFDFQPNIFISHFFFITKEMYTVAMSFALQRRAMSGHCLNSMNPLFSFHHVQKLLI